MPRNYIPKPKRQIIYPIGPSIAYIPLTKNQFALIDSDDIERCSIGTWYAIWGTRSYYASRRNKGEYLQLHRFILNAENGACVDHIHHNTLDNRKSQLRIASQIQNQRNRGLQTNNKSGFKGVHFDKASNKYRAGIELGTGKKLWLGMFSSIDDAAAAYRDAAIKYHGEFANF